MATFAVTFQFLKFLLIFNGTCFIDSDSLPLLTLTTMYSSSTSGHVTLTFQVLDFTISISKIPLATIPVKSFRL